MRNQFRSNAQVLELAWWMARRLPDLAIRLDMPHSTFVPGGLRADTVFGRLVPDHFRWRLGGMATGTWQETLLRLRSLAVVLRQGVARHDVPATLQACRDIADWGVDRNARVGATAFVLNLGDELPDYLERVRDAMWLTLPDPTGRFRMIPRMNSTLCKIHSLCAADGLPIYESRVAAAISVLVEAWRRESGRDAQPLPPELRFPAVGSQLHRRVRQLFPQADDPGILAYANSSEVATAGRWADATVRLGLLMELVLQHSDPSFCVAWPADPVSHARTARMAALASSLFVAGYDLQCMSALRLRAGD